MTDQEPQRATFHRPPTAQQAVLAELRAMIGSGELAPGQRLRQEQLATQLGVSRVPVREALRALAAEGQVTYTPHRGYLVAQLSLAELTECYRLRDLLEDEAVRVAVPRLEEADLARMAAAITDMDRAVNDVAAVAAANRRFHFVLYRAAGMPRLLELIRILWDATDRYRSHYFAEPAHRVDRNAEHRAVLASVGAGDTGAALRILTAHRAHTLTTLATQLAPTEATR